MKEVNIKRDYKIFNHEPKQVLKNFANISKIPRVSGNSKQISNYLFDFFKKFATTVKKDKANNIIAFLKATKGYEDRPPVCLQSHYDMVYDVHKDYKHNPKKDQIKPYIKDGWLKAEGTTLGADNGIGVAMIMSIFEDKKIEHGPIWAILTSDEEIGTVGAAKLERNSTDARYLINIDAEKNNRIYIGCGCGKGYAAYTKIKFVDFNKSDFLFKISIEGLLGGHSGMEIHKRKANATVILSNFIYELAKTIKLNLVDIEIGKAINAIPTNGWVSVAIAQDDVEDFKTQLLIMFNDFKTTYGEDEPNFITNFEQLSIHHEKKISQKDTQRILNAMMLIPNGMVYYDQKYTCSMLSNNISKIDIINDTFNINWLARGLYEFDVNLLNEKALVAVRTLEFEKIEMNLTYQNWIPYKGKLLNIYRQIIEKNLNQKTEDFVFACAGLEVGVILKRNASIAEAISIGPNIVDAHSYSEKTSLESIEVLWKSLKELLIKLDK